jgi:transcriptional regulator with GAF, ATPase, and Fis domain
MYLHVFYKNEYYKTLKMDEKDFPFSIGRTEDNNLSLAFDDLISRHHARIVHHDEDFEIEDCGSKNGIYLDGKKVQKQKLVYEKKIGIGNSSLVFSTEPFKEIKKTLLIDAKFFDKNRKPDKGPDSEKLLASLYSLSTRIFRCENEDALWKEVFAELVRMFSPDRILYFEADPSLKKAVVRKREDISLTASRQGFSESVTKEILSTSKAIYIQNVIQEIPDHTKTIRQMGISSLIAVPLFHQKQLSGILELELFQPVKCFEEPDFIALCILSHLLSGFLQNRKKIEKIEIENEWYKENFSRNYEIIGKDIKFRAWMDLLKKAAPANTTVLLTGESGTGKECAARAIHRLSSRKDKPLMVINCASVPEPLMESEFFGYEKGAFTGAFTKRMGKLEAASGGTVFLDEIGEMPLPLQAKLLRFLEDGEIQPVGSNETRLSDVRIIAATNRDLKKAMAEKMFREDLFYRLSVIQIHCPPLRERPGDILEIARFYLKKFSLSMGKQMLELSEDTCRFLLSYPWPGNIRELKNAMERACVIGEGAVLEIPFLPDHIKQPFVEASSFPEPRKNPLSQKGSFLEEKEKEHILHIFYETNKNKAKTAELLGITRKTLYSKLKRWNVF